MKLLFDHHLSRKLVARIADCFPASSHVVFHGLDQADDRIIWAFAATHDFVIVTKDSDFNDVATIHGVPPKVIWLRMGNCSTAHIEQALRKNQGVIAQFVQARDPAVLEIM